MLLGIGLYLKPLSMIANQALIKLADMPVQALLSFLNAAIIATGFQ